MAATRDGLAIGLFGHPRLSVDGSPFALHCRPRTVALLGFLLLHRDAYLPRDVLAFTLWPDDTESLARANLRRHLHDLTSALPPSPLPYVVGRNDTLVWNNEAAVRVDVWDFERLAADESTWPQAVTLYAGDLLPTIYDDWIFPIRDRLHSTYVGLVEKLMLKARQARDFGAAAALAQKILVDDTWREDTLRQLASIRYEAGDRAGALHDIDGFVTRLSREMHAEPMPETLALRAQILRGSELRDAEASAAEPVAAPSLPFVGREQEMQILLSAWKRAARSRGQVVFVGGDAGMGKTRLADEFAFVAATQGARVLRGTTSEPEGIPYQAIVEALRDAAPLTATLPVRPVWLSALASLMPELELSRDDLPSLSPLESGRESSRLNEAMAAVLQALAKPRPVVLIVEDLHWAGGSTIAALGYLARRIAGMPVLAIATYRTSEVQSANRLPDVRRQLLTENLAANVVLGGISEDAVLALARATPALAGASSDFAARIHSSTLGNPLFAGELLRDVAETGAHDGIARGLRATLASRFGRLSEHALLVAEIGSVAGSAFDVDLVSEVWGGDGGAVLDAVAELLDRRLVREVGASRFALTFTHEVISSQLYERIATDVRRRWHKRIASVLERASGDEKATAAALARHYDRAECAEEAARWYLVAARHAFAVFANTEALADASRGLQLAVQARLRFDVLAIREQTLSRLGDRAAQTADLEALQSLADDLGDRDAISEVLWRRALHAHSRGDRAEAEQLLREFSTQARARGDVAHEALALRETANMLYEASRYDQATTAAQEALRRYQYDGDIAGEVESYCLLAEIAVNHGSANASELLERALNRARESGNAVLAARAAMAASQIAIMRRDFTAARAASMEARQAFLEIGDREGEGEARARIATASGMLRRFDEAYKEADLAAEIFKTLGSRRKLAHLLFNRSAGEMNVGILDAAAASANAALRIFEDDQDDRGRASCLNNLSMIRLHQGSAREAKATALQALESARAIENRLIEAAILSNLGNAERELAEVQSGLAHMQEAFAIRKQLGLLPEIEEMGDFALTQLAKGDREAVRTAETLLRRAGKAGENTVWPYYCYWAAARVYHHFGDGRANKALSCAMGLVNEHLVALTNPNWRVAFSSLPVVCAIRAAAERDEWP